MAFPTLRLGPWRYWLSVVLRADLAALCPNLVREIDTGVRRSD